MTHTTDPDKLLREALTDPEAFAAKIKAAENEVGPAKQEYDRARNAYFAAEGKWHTLLATPDRVQYVEEHDGVLILQQPNNHYTEIDGPRSASVTGTLNLKRFHVGFYGIATGLGALRDHYSLSESHQIAKDWVAHGKLPEEAEE